MNPLRPAFGAARFLVQTPVTLVHEFSHIVVGTATGGFATSLRMSAPDTAVVNAFHLTFVSRFVSPAVGYVAPPLIGVVMVALAMFEQDFYRDGIPGLFMLAVGGVCLLLSRNLFALAASLWVIMLSLSMTTFEWLPGEWLGLALALLGTIEAARLMVGHITHGATFPSDATSLSLGFIPPALHAFVWLSVSSIALLACIAMIFA